MFSRTSIVFFLEFAVRRLSISTALTLTCLPILGCADTPPPPASAPTFAPAVNSEPLSSAARAKGTGVRTGTAAKSSMEP